MAEKSSKGANGKKMTKKQQEEEQKSLTALKMEEVSQRHETGSSSSAAEDDETLSQRSSGSSTPARSSSSGRRSLKNRSRACSVPGCLSKVRTRGLCIAHGGGRRCSVAGCTSGARPGGRCVLHGGGKRCIVSGCNNSAQRKGVCVRHFPLSKEGWKLVEASSSSSPSAGQAPTTVQSHMMSPFYHGYSQAGASPVATFMGGNGSPHFLPTVQHHSRPMLQPVEVHLPQQTSLPAQLQAFHSSNSPAAKPRLPSIRELQQRTMAKSSPAVSQISPSPQARLVSLQGSMPMRKADGLYPGFAASAMLPSLASSSPASSMVSSTAVSPPFMARPSSLGPAYPVAYSQQQMMFSGGPVAA